MSIEKSLNSAEWLHSAVRSVLDAIPRNHPIDLHAIGAIILLRASQTNVPLTVAETEAAIVAACLEEKRTVEL